MRECKKCFGTGRLGWDVTPGRRRAKVTCKMCAGTGWHHDEVFKPTVEVVGGSAVQPLTFKALLYLYLKIIFGGFRWAKNLLQRWVK